MGTGLPRVQRKPGCQLPSSTNRCPRLRQHRHRRLVRLPTLSRRGALQSVVKVPLIGGAQSEWQSDHPAAGQWQLDRRIQSATAVSKPRSDAQTPICVRELNPSLSMMCSMCAAAARSVMTSCSAICLLVHPCGTSAATSACLGVSVPAGSSCAVRLATARAARGAVWPTCARAIASARLGVPEPPRGICLFAERGPQRE
jgi:hypothetical protein